MVRTYTQNYQLTSPWEQAMKNAEQEDHKHTANGKRIYENNGASNGTYDFTHNMKQPKLPPIKDDPHKLISFLAEEIGETLSRDEKLKTIEKEFILYDPYSSGIMTKSSVLEILRRYKIPKNQKDQTKLAACFTAKDNPNKISHSDLLEYLENCKDNANNKRTNGTVIRNENVQDTQRIQLADSTHGRYDSIKTADSNTSRTNGSFGRGAVNKEAFQQKRDAGLLLEIEKAFKQTQNPHNMVDQLERTLKQTCRNDENLVDNKHIKGLVDQHRFPLNRALTLKCIERFDVKDQGRIEWPNFIAFLRKGISSLPTSTQEKSPVYSLSGKYAKLPETNYLKVHQNRQNSSDSWREDYSTNSQNSIPDKPAWESRAPLQSISPKNANNAYQHNVEAEDELWFQPYETSSRQEPSSDHVINDASFYNNEKTNQEGEACNDTHMGNRALEFYPDTSSLGGSNIMDSDIEDAFENYANQLKLNNLNSEKDEKDNENGPDFSMMGDRGLAYKRVADALKDKSKRTNDIIEATEIQKIVNYYNLLFDTNISSDQVENVINKHSNGGSIDVKTIINSFGTEII